MMDKLHVFEEDDDLSATYICSHGLMRGTTISVSTYRKKEIAEWKTHACKVEEHMKHRRETKNKQLRQQMEVATAKMEKQRQLRCLNFTVDDNHNSVSGGQESILPMSLESVDFKKLNIGAANETYHAVTTLQREHVVGERIVSLMPPERRPESCVSDSQLEKPDSDIVSQMKTLITLQEEQKELDMWHENMQKQLMFEQIRLKEKYDKMKLQNVRRQQEIIDQSRDCLINSALDIGQNVNSQHTVNKTPEMCEANNIQAMLEQSLKTPDFGSPKQSPFEYTSSKSSVLGTPSLRDTPASAVVKQLSNESKSGKRTKRNLPTPPPFVLKSDTLKERAETPPAFEQETLENSRDSSFFAPGAVLYRRKSRPAKFFDTPTSLDKTSDKHLHVFVQSGFDDSQEKPCTPQGCNVSTTSFEATVHQKFSQPDKLYAAVKGYLTRRLMKSKKVVDIIKTIRDTQLVLEDVNKENKPVSHADKQMMRRLHDELFLKHEKLHKIFFSADGTERARLLAISRLQEKERTLSNTKPIHNKPSPMRNKKLSVASQRTMQRRLLTSCEKRPETAPGQIYSPSKVTKESSRVLQPIQSRSSPVLSRPKTADDVLNKQGTKKRIVKKLNMNSATKPKRGIAATFKNRTSSVI